MRGRPPTSISKGKGRKKGITPPKRNSDSESDTQSPQQSQQPVHSDSDDSEVVGLSASTSRSSSRGQQPRQITTREVQGAIEAIGPTDKGKEPRKKRPAVTISEAQEAAALDFLKSNPLLYDRSMKEYKDVARREMLWEELANQVTTKRHPIKTEDIKKWFESQRTIYGKSTKLVAGQSGRRLSDRKKWVVIEFGFLAGHISRQTSKDSTIKSQTDSIVAEPASQCRGVDYDSDDAGPSRSEKRR